MLITLRLYISSQRKLRGFITNPSNLEQHHTKVVTFETLIINHFHRIEQRIKQLDQVKMVVAHQRLLADTSLPSDMVMDVMGYLWQ
jgi:hypothetical protein